MSPDDRERLVRIETKLDSTLDRLDDHEKRIRRTEYVSWSASGAVALLAAIFKLHS